MDNKQLRYIILSNNGLYMYRDRKNKLYSFTREIKKANQYKTPEIAMNKVYKNLDSDYWYYGEGGDKNCTAIGIDEEYELYFKN